MTPLDGRERPAVEQARLAVGAPCEIPGFDDAGRITDLCWGGDRWYAVAYLRRQDLHVTVPVDRVRRLWDA